MHGYWWRVWACVFLAALVAGAIAAEDKSGEFVPLFDGASLQGWEGDPDLWRVEDGEIVGSTDAKKLTHNSFLATHKSYRNFVLRLKFKLRNGNSGVQFRSRRFEDYVVRGYQADIADNQFLGILYEEGGRGILANVDAQNVARHYKPGDWNEYEITADGPRITQKLNGHVTVEYEEADREKGAAEGVVALQLHVGDAMEIRFKDLEIKELP